MLATRKAYEAVTLQASTTRIATGQTAAARLPTMLRSIDFVLDCTAGGTGGLDSLHIGVQTRLDGPDGNQWLTVVQFTTVTGDAPNKTYVEKIDATLPEAGFEIGSALGAGSVRNLIGDDWRVSYVLVGGGATFTFSVTAIPS